MAIIIDGYNLLNVCGVFPQAGGPHTLERARYALLNFLAEALPAEEVPLTIVVFDAANAPPGLDRVRKYRGITVRFAAEFAEADDLIEILIRKDHSPKKLTVVSSDHRLQRAAKRRKAKAIDSEVWYERMLHNQPVETPQEPGKPPAPLPPEEVENWLEAFGNVDAAEAIDFSSGPLGRAFKNRNPASADDQPSKKQPPDDAADGTEPHASEEDERNFNRRAEELFEGFPPGYGEDLLDEDI